ncbi:alpha/beta hydrolase family protein [Glacieibacterium frigidum]|uniref:Alpha/beta hydrolase n=1 Tax=Glacieibacterium frigidum TaxID=2593303 RepID=A0A552U8A7_9SPHN|nr:alpha/beta hydrolase [Glacieibacterium frigidum]TRW14450.1 alpha/beta hydrolase [Glacieibacterium frigidum]
MHRPAGPSLTRRSVLAGLAVASTAAAAPAPLLLTTADGRISSVTRWPARGRHRGVIGFSHGALSAPWKYAALVEPWAAAGFEVLAPLHVDSSDHPDTARYPGLASWAARIADMRALGAHIGDVPWVAAGHSYGGLTALTLGGAAASVPPGVTGPLRASGVNAVIAFSPPGPIPGLIDAPGYAQLGVPALIQTGDRDVPPGSTAPDAWRTHLAAYEASAAGGDRYSLVLAGADHYFGNLICRPERTEAPQRAQLDAATRVAGLFLRGFGDGDAKARTRLDGQLSPTLPVMLMRK